MTERKKNPFAKTRDISKPYAVYVHPTAGWEWHVLKTYRRPDLEKGAYDRWFVAAKSPMTYGDFEYGDTYKGEVIQNGWLDLDRTDPEWLEAFEGGLEVKRTLGLR